VDEQNQQNLIDVGYCLPYVVSANVTQKMIHKFVLWKNNNKQDKSIPYGKKLSIESVKCIEQKAIFINFCERIDSMRKIAF